MSQTSIDAGKLNQPVEILTIQESPAGTWSWQSTRPARAQVELTTRSNLFSQVGIGARGAELVLRRQALTLHQAILWGEQHLFLTAILPEGRLRAWELGQAQPLFWVRARLKSTPLRRRALRRGRGARPHILLPEGRL